MGIQNRQDTYSATHEGKRWQGLRTHSVNPADDNQAAPNIGMACPGDQLSEPWHAAIRSGNKRMAIQCDCYDGPLGRGYTISVFTTVLGVEYSRTINVGAETHRNVAWHEVTV